MSDSCSRYPIEISSPQIKKRFIGAGPEISQSPELKPQINLLSVDKHVATADGLKVPYDKLCICTGAKPNQPIREENDVTTNQPISEENYIITIRDTDTVEDLQRRLKNARKVVVVGNGGIALELV